MNQEIGTAAAPSGLPFALRAHDARAEGEAKQSTPRIEMAPRTRRFMREVAGTDWENDAGRPSDTAVSIQTSSADARVLIRLLIAICVGIAVLEVARQLGT